MTKLGALCPEDLLGRDHAALAEYVGALEEMGYSFISAPDHVLGADRASRPNWRPYFGKPPLLDHTDAFHEPFVLFGLLTALTKTIELATGVLISPQRQAALLAKQAAQVDFLSGGRLRLVLGTGWNDIEFEALNVDFAARGEIIDEQVALCRLLWTDELVTYKGKHHTVTAAGIKPLPVQRPIPVWFGGASAPVLRRTGTIGDGWFPWYPTFNEENIRADIDTIHRYAREAGRDPSAIGIQAMIFFNDDRFESPPGSQPQPTTIDECVAYALQWKELGATHNLVFTPWAGSSVDDRLGALRDFKQAVGADF